MTDDWLKEIGNKKIVWGCTVFSAAFDIIDQNLLLKKTHGLWLFNLCHIMDSELQYLSNRTERGFSLMEASLMLNM